MSADGAEGPRSIFPPLLLLALSLLSLIIGHVIIF